MLLWWLWRCKKIPLTLLNKMCWFHMRWFCMHVHLKQYCTFEYDIKLQTTYSSSGLFIFIPVTNIFWVTPYCVVLTLLDHKGNELIIMNWEWTKRVHEYKAKKITWKAHVMHVLRTRWISSPYYINWLKVTSAEHKSLTVTFEILDCSQVFPFSLRDVIQRMQSNKLVAVWASGRGYRGRRCYFNGFSF